MGFISEVFCEIFEEIYDEVTDVLTMYIEDDIEYIEYINNNVINILTEEHSSVEYLSELINVPFSKLINEMSKYDFRFKPIHILKICHEFDVPLLEMFRGIHPDCDCLLTRIILLNNHRVVTLRLKRKEFFTLFESDRMRRLKRRVYKYENNIKN